MNILKKDNDNDTIIAQATPPGRGGVSILRISGLKAYDVANIILGKIPVPRYADYLAFKDTNGNVFDYGIALWFPKPNSFTGEDVLELQGHGGPVVSDLLLEYILTLSDDIRIANPGEFSKRAFINNKIDLTQAEAITDLINASSKQAVRSALESFQGMFSIRINHLIEALINLRVHVEAAIDFPCEEIDTLSNESINIQLDQIISNINIVQKEAYYGNLLREGMKIVISGHPNAGKSSLFNALIGRKAAIVTDIAGTTRDILREHININGIPLCITDTAGLRYTNDRIERISIKHAWKEIKRANRILLVVDSTTTSSVNPIDIHPNFISRLSINLPITVIRNKVDITGEKIGFSDEYGYSIIRLSARTGEGIDILRDHLKQSVEPNIGMEDIFLARRRHLQALKKATNHLIQSKKYAINDSCISELLAEELYLAQQALKEITGDFASNDLIERIFSKFCIGK